MKNWGLSLKVIANLAREANKNLAAVINRLRLNGTEEMDDLAEFLISSKNRKEILRMN